MERDSRRRGRCGAGVDRRWLLQLQRLLRRSAGRGGGRQERRLPLQPGLGGGGDGWQLQRLLQWPGERDEGRLVRRLPRSHGGARAAMGGAAGGGP